MLVGEVRCATSTRSASCELSGGSQFVSAVDQIVEVAPGPARQAAQEELCRSTPMRSRVSSGRGAAEPAHQRGRRDPQRQKHERRARSRSATQQHDHQQHRDSRRCTSICRMVDA